MSLRLLVLERYRWCASMAWGSGAGTLYQILWNPRLGASDPAAAEWHPQSFPLSGRSLCPSALKGGEASPVAQW